MLTAHLPLTAGDDDDRHFPGNYWDHPMLSVLSECPRLVDLSLLNLAHSSSQKSKLWPPFSPSVALLGVRKPHGPLNRARAGVAPRIPIAAARAAANAATAAAEAAATRVPVAAAAAAAPAVASAASAAATAAAAAAAASEAASAVAGSKFVYSRIGEKVFIYSSSPGRHRWPEVPAPPGLLQQLLWSSTPGGLTDSRRNFDRQHRCQGRRQHLHYEQSRRLARRGAAASAAVVAASAAAAAAAATATSAPASVPASATAASTPAAVAASAAITVRIGGGKWGA